MEMEGILMKFLFTQMIIVILVCIFIAALSNLTELGAIGWILAASTGHALYKIYKHMYYSFRTGDKKQTHTPYRPQQSYLSEQIRSFMFDDATELHDD